MFFMSADWSGKKKRNKKSEELFLFLGNCAVLSEVNVKTAKQRKFSFKINRNSVKCFDSLNIREGKKRNNEIYPEKYDNNDNHSLNTNTTTTTNATFQYYYISTTTTNTASTTTTSTNASLGITKVKTSVSRLPLIGVLVFS